MKYLVCFLSIALHSGLTMAQDHQSVLENYLTDDVAAVAYIDLSQIDTLGAMEWADSLGLGPADATRGQAAKLMLMVQGQLDKYAEFGARYIYVLFRASDVRNGGPTWFVPVAPDGNPEAVMGMVLSGRPDRMDIERDLRPRFFPEYCEAIDDAVLCANSPEQLEMLKATRPTRSRALAAAFDALGTGHGGLIVFGDPDSRRVLRELFPTLPKPFDAIDGIFLADRLQWGGVVVDLPPEPKAKVVVQTDQVDAAATLEQVFQAGVDTLRNLPLDVGSLSTEEFDAIAELLEARVEGDRFILSFDKLLSNAKQTSDLLKPRVQLARKTAQKQQRISKFRKIALAMLNYESARGTYPPRSTFDEDGKPLLSWRVHVLPYMGEEEHALYKRFHLDEPWDSEHNKQLVPLMPDVYVDPDPALTDRNAVGRTTFVVPAGVGAAFENSAGKPIREITDGTSNTLMLVELWSGAAPYWSRPRDWVMDSSLPWERLPRRGDRDEVTVSFCDGFVRTIPFSTPGETLRALMTAAGGEVVDLP